MRRSIGVVALAAVLGCGVTGPKLTLGRSDGSVGHADGPGITGSLTDPKSGATVATGSIYLDPAAMGGMLLEYFEQLFHHGAVAAKSASGG